MKALWIVFILIGAAYGRVYYVSQTNPYASDGNPGTESLPFKTIQNGAAMAGAGDTVYVMNGTYREIIDLKRGGSGYDNMLCFIAGGDSVIVDGADPVTGWVQFDGGIWMKSGWTVNSQQVFVDGEPLQQIGGNPYYSPDRLPAIGSGRSDMFAGTFYYDTTEENLYVWLKDGSDPNLHNVEVSVRPYLFLVNGLSYVFLSGFNFIHSNTTAVIKTGWPAVNVTGTNCIVEDCQATWCDFTGIGGTCDSLLVKNCVCNYNGDTGMGFSGAYLRIIGNTTSYNNYRGFTIDWHAGGMKNTNLKYSVVENHTSVGNNGPGIWFDITCDYDTISSCLSHDNTGDGIFYEISRHALISNNSVYNNQRNGIYVSASDSCIIANNTITSNFRGLTIHGVPRLGYQLVGNMAVNNIIANNNDCEVVVARPDTDAYNNTADYNLFYHSGDIPRFEFGYDYLIVGLPQWLRATSLDSHSLEADPKFVNPGAGDFQLTSSSPAIGKGIKIPIVQVDHNAVTRIQNDIGAYEYQP